MDNLNFLKINFAISKSFSFKREDANRGTGVNRIKEKLDKSCFAVKNVNITSSGRNSFIDVEDSIDYVQNNMVATKINFLNGEHGNGSGNGRWEVSFRKTYNSTDEIKLISEERLSLNSNNSIIFSIQTIELHFWTCGKGYLIFYGDLKIDKESEISFESLKFFLEEILGEKDNRICNDRNEKYSLNNLLKLSSLSSQMQLIVNEFQYDSGYKTILYGITTNDYLPKEDDLIGNFQGHSLWSGISKETLVQPYNVDKKNHYWIAGKNTIFCIGKKGVKFLWDGKNAGLWNNFKSAHIYIYEYFCNLYDLGQRADSDFYNGLNIGTYRKFLKCSGDINNKNAKEHIQDLYECCFLRNALGLKHLKIDIDAYRNKLERADESSIQNNKIPMSFFDEKKPYLFISYSHKDFKKVYQYLASFYNEDINFWYDEGLENAKAWDEAAKPKLENSRGVIIFVSVEYFKSPNTIREYMWAKENGIELYIVNLENLTSYYDIFRKVFSNKEEDPLTAVAPNEKMQHISRVAQYFNDKITYSQKDEYQICEDDDFKKRFKSCYLK